MAAGKETLVYTFPANVHNLQIRLSSEVDSDLKLYNYDEETETILDCFLGYVTLILTHRSICFGKSFY